MKMKRLYWKIVLTEGIFLFLILAVAMWIIGMSHEDFKTRRQEDRTAAVELMEMALANDLAPELSLENLEKVASRLFKGDVRIVESDAPPDSSALETFHFSRGGTTYTLLITPFPDHKDGRGGFVSFLVHDKYGPILLILAMALGLLAVPLARIVTKPLGELRRDMRQFASGDLAHRTTVASKDEVGEVARDFNEMAESIQSLVRVGKEMTAHVSHELRSPLTRIDIARQVLEEQLAGKQLDLLDSMREEIEGMDGLIDKILRLSRLELNESAPEPLCFVEILQEAVRRHGPSFAAKDVRLQGNFPENLPGTGVKEDIVCLVDNLLSNALKFSSSGGNADVSLRERQGKVVLSVSNDAQEPSLSPNRLAEPFQRGGASESVPGSGLGLAIAQRIVENHGGSLSLSWSKGQFSAVVELPQGDG